MMPSLRVIVILSLFTFITVPFAAADSISLGVLSFDQGIPVDSTQNIPGTNLFDISAYTGTNALPADFPVSSEITLENVVLTLFDQLGQAQTIALSTIDENNPGAYSVSSISQFTSAELTATVNGSSQPVLLTLSDGSTVTIDPNIQIVLLPANGNVLTAGNDLAVVSAVQMPEPSPWYFLGLSAGGLIAFVFWERRRLLTK